MEPVTACNLRKPTLNSGYCVKQTSAALLRNRFNRHNSPLSQPTGWHFLTRGQMQIVKRLNQLGGGAQIPHRIITHSVAEFVDDPHRGIHWAPDYETTLGLSAHYYVTPSGVIIQQREDHQIAWHAKGHNTDTIGIEWMVPGVHDYESFLTTIKTNYIKEEQYFAGLELYKQLISRHGIKVQERHSDVDPSRKQDPGSGFPWDALNLSLR